MSGDPREVTRLDLDVISERGPSESTPCALCEKLTRSHIIAEVEGTVYLLDARDTDVHEVLDCPPGTPVTFGPLCHGCASERDFPLTGESGERFEAVAGDDWGFEGVAGR